MLEYLHDCFHALFKLSEEAPRTSIRNVCKKTSGNIREFAHANDESHSAQSTRISRVRIFVRSKHSLIFPHIQSFASIRTFYLTKSDGNIAPILLVDGTNTKREKSVWRYDVTEETIVRNNTSAVTAVDKDVDADLAAYTTNICW